MTTCEEDKKKLNTQNADLKKKLSTATADNASLKGKLTNVNRSWEEIQTARNKSSPTFWVSALALFLLILVPGVTFLYSGVVNHQVMMLVKNNGVLDAMAQTFKTGDFSVDIDGEEHTFEYFWNEVLVTIMKTILRGRFFMLLALFVVMLCTILYTYTIYYRGENYKSSARMIAIALSAVLLFTFIFVSNRTMIQPFENVVGYGILTTFMGSQLRDVMNRIFRHKYFTNKYVFPGANLYFDFLLNVFSIENFPVVLEEIYKNNAKYDFEINTGDNGISPKLIETLFEIILNKNTIGYMCWTYFACLVGMMISFQYILSNEM